MECRRIPNAELDFSKIPEDEQYACLSWETLREVHKQAGSVPLDSFLVDLGPLVKDRIEVPYAQLTDDEKGLMRDGIECGRFFDGQPVNELAYADPPWYYPLSGYQRVTFAFRPDATKDELRKWFREWLKKNREGKKAGPKSSPMTDLQALALYRLRRDHSINESITIFQSIYVDRPDLDASRVSESWRLAAARITGYQQSL